MAIGEQEFPSEKGTYILFLQLNIDIHLTIGKRRTFDFLTGVYAYVGSAFGSGGLRGRLKHHLKPVTKPHWHIDYLRSAAPVSDIWYVADDTRYEHMWATTLGTMPDALIPVSRFGSSDCTCAAHLMYFAKKPTLEAFNSVLTDNQIRIVHHVLHS